MHLTVDLLVEITTHDNIKDPTKTVKSNKALGSAGIPSEPFRSGGDAL